MKLFKYCSVLIFIFIGCDKKIDSFGWVSTIPKPWTLSKIEFESYLPQFQKRFPIYHDRIKALNLWRVGTPYGIFCLGEESGIDKDPIIRFDTSDCTVHVLTTLAFAESYTWQNARDVMGDIHYKMDENGVKKPTYKSRWHYTSDRILNHSRTIDITPVISSTESKEIVKIELNKKEDGSEFLELDWSPKVEIQYLPTRNVTEELLKTLPSVCGIAFVKRSYFKMGIIIAHEGYLIDQKYLIHASQEEGKTIDVNLIEYLNKNGNSKFDGIMVYKIEQA